MSEISGISGATPLPGAPPPEALPQVPTEEVEDLELAVGMMKDLIGEAQKEKRKQLGPRFAHQAAREAFHIQERVYRLLPATGVIPNELPLPMGVLPDEVAALNRPVPEEFGPVNTHLPDQLMSQNGELTTPIAPEIRSLPDDLATRVAHSYSVYNSLLRESGLGEAMRTSSVPRWAETFGP